MRAAVGQGNPCASNASGERGILCRLRESMDSRILKKNPLRGEPIQVWRHHKVVSIAFHLGSQVIHDNEENVLECSLRRGRFATGPASTGDGNQAKVGQQRRPDHGCQHAVVGGRTAFSKLVKCACLARN